VGLLKEVRRRQQRWSSYCWIPCYLAGASSWRGN